MNKIQKQCEVCGQSFVPKTVDSVYCSKKCGAAAYRKKKAQKKEEEQQEILNIALDYTRKSFALYLSDDDLDVLCRNVRAYMDKLDEKELKPVKVKELTALDLRHFGWNIWNYFKPRNQMDIANFLKIVFPNIFRDATEDSIKSHLKDDELKGIIKIKEVLL